MSKASDSISTPQYKLLKRINKLGSVKFESFSDKEKEICNFLLQNNYVSADGIYGYDVFSSSSRIHNLPLKVQITQLGEAKMYTFKMMFYKWWIPVVISILSLVVSIFKP